MMDVLSEVLRTVKLEGALFFNAEFSAPWCLRSAASARMAPYLRPGAGHVILYHFLIEGRATIQLPGGEQKQELAAGDIVILPHGDPHLLGNGPAYMAVDSLKTFSRSLKDSLQLTRFGGGGEITRFVCGFMACEPRLSEVFLAGLPRILKVHVADGPSGQWIRDSILFSVSRVNGSVAGSGLVLAKLSEVLFVETLRVYMNALPPDQLGWLAGARDPAIGKVLALLHKDPARPWSITDFAKSVGLSRTRFVERFRRFLGKSPMVYLAEWRLKLAAEILQSTEDSVAAVAEAVGYGSEASFNRAFRREFGRPPARFRRDRKSAAAQKSEKLRTPR
jgi:AraC-like DNA-binding protein